MEHIRENIKTNAAAKRARTVSTASYVLADGSLLEMLYDPVAHRTTFVSSKDGAWEIVPEQELPDGRRLVPLSPLNNLLAHGVVLFPSHPEEFGTKEALLKSIQAYLHRYVDLSPLFERIAAHYVLLSWLYDGFHEVPYLRVRGEPGSGKTRFLLALGSISYKPIFASGASTVAPLFRMLDLIRGTLILDEADFRFSDERSEIIKILNNGTTRGFPVLRVEANPATKEFNPHAFHVFGPKLVASRGSFDDRALETRFITEQMGTRRLRDDIPINLTENLADDALRLRNQLLLFRLRSYEPTRSVSPLPRTIEPRVNQMFAPILSLVDDEDTREAFRALARVYHEAMIGDRGQEVEALLLEVVRDLTVAQGSLPSVSEIAKTFSERHGAEIAAVTPRWVGQVLRRRLGLATVRRRDGYVIAPVETEKLRGLLDRFGLAVAERDLTEERSPHPPSSLDPEPRAPVEVNVGNEVNTTEAPADPLHSSTESYPQGLLPAAAQYAVMQEQGMSPYA